jgi:FKBP-type peptidyl-prolyl cis-trans isomerase FkpA
MSDTKMSHRIFAFFMAGLFLFSACAFSAFVIYDMAKSKKQANDAANVSKAAQEAQAQAKKPSGNELQGKPLEGFAPVDSVPELQTTDTVVGDGDEAKAGDSVTVDYTGAVAKTGIVFQSSKDSGQPAQLSLDSVIDGWKQGIPGMKVGGTRRLLIPASMAYGSTPPQGSGIPADADLVFDVTLHKVGK